MTSKGSISREELKEVFDGFDSEKKGRLNEEQIKGFADKYPTHIKSSDCRNIFKHMSIHQDESTITFDEFYVWWENKEKNLLPVLYFKQQVQKKLQKAKQKIEKQKQGANENAQKNSFSVSLNNGKNQKETFLGLKASTHVQADLDAEHYRKFLNLGMKPAFIFKILVTKNKDIDEAKTTLEDLVEQGKQILECVLPMELSEQYLKLVDIQVEKEGQYLILSISSNNELIKSIYQSYQGLVDEFKFQDQSVVFEATYSSQLDIGKAASTSNSILADVLKGLVIDVSLNSSSVVLDNLRQLLYTKIESELYGQTKEQIQKKNNEGGQQNAQPKELSNKKSTEYSLMVISALLNGISMKLNTDRIEDMLPPQATSLTFEQLIEKAKQANTKAEEALSFPIFQDVLNFFNEYTLSDSELVVIGPGIFASVNFKTNGLSTLLNKIFQP